MVLLSLFCFCSLTEAINGDSKKSLFCMDLIFVASFSIFVSSVLSPKKMSSGSLFGDSTELANIEIELDNLPEYSKKEILELEKASLGFFDLSYFNNI